MTKKPNFFIVGAPKCGTTSMSEYLKQHPEIFISKQKEPHYFSTDLITRIPHDEAKYLALFAGAKTERRIGEASVWYLYSKVAPKKILQFNPSSRIIIMLRHPVDMLYSLHSQFLFTGNENIADFQEALNAEEERRNGHLIPKLARFPRGLLYSDIAKYSEHIKRYFDMFGKEKVHIIIFDDLKKDMAKIYKDTLRFLDVSQDFQPEYQVINPNKAVRSQALLILTKVLVFMGRRMYPLVFRPLGIGFVNRLTKLNTRYVSRPQMDTELKKRLQKKFEPEISKLSRLLSRDLSVWIQKS